MSILVRAILTRPALAPHIVRRSRILSSPFLPLTRPSRLFTSTTFPQQDTKESHKDNDKNTERPKETPVESQGSQNSTKARNTNLAYYLFAAVAAMIALAYASVPLYRLFCQITGLGGTTQRSTTAIL